jgi:D-tyrosyl-tRNA(Tyr) deacylase
LKAVVQRVSSASVSVAQEVLGQIGPGLLVLLGIGTEDSETDLNWMVDKILHLRCFEDEEGKMNLSLLDAKKEVLCVSQFTLYGDCRRGRRPSFGKAAAAPQALLFCQKFVDKMREKGVEIKFGRFGAKMTVALKNEGPVTLILDSRT